MESESYMDLVKRYLAAVEENNFDALTELLAPNFINKHFAVVVARDRETFIQSLRDGPAYYSNVFGMSVEEDVVSYSRIIRSRDDLVPFQTGTVWLRIEDGKIVERRAHDRRVTLKTDSTRWAYVKLTFVRMPNSRGWRFKGYEDHRWMDVLNQHGMIGWELAAVVELDLSTREFILKRPVEFGEFHATEKAGEEDSGASETEEGTKE